MSLIQNFVDPDWVQALYKGKSPEHTEAIRYLAMRNLDLGCLRSSFLKSYPLLTDNEYDKMMYDLSRVKDRALRKLGISIESVLEIDPVCFQGYDIGSSILSTNRGDIWVGSSYQVTWLFFSDRQVFYYQYNFSSIDNDENEMTEEYFYKDIIGFSTSTVRTEAHGYSPQGQPQTEIISQLTFQMKTAAGALECSLRKNDITAERSIKNMREVLRLKKID